MKTNNKNANFNKTVRKALGYSIIGIYAILIMLVFIALKPTGVLGPINLAFVTIPTSLPTPTPTPVPTSTPTPVPTNELKPTTPSPVPSQKPKTPKEILKSLAPYTGTNFKMVYNNYITYSEFLITINSKNPASGEAEFDNFLRQNGIPGMSAIGGGFEVEVKPF